jgi:hypothetical protein
MHIDHHKLRRKKNYAKEKKNQEPPVDVDHRLMMLEVMTMPSAHRCSQRRTIALSAVVIEGGVMLLLGMLM